MHKIDVSQTWAEQIAVIRDARTDITNIVRPGLDHYRICKNSNDSFLISLYASQPQGSIPLVLMVRERKFYVHQIGANAMGRYSSEIKTDEKTKQKFQVSQWRMDSAIHDLEKGRNESKRFENQTLLTFCVAESLRSDAIAQKIAGTIQRAETLDIQEWLGLARNWGATSSQILQGRGVSSDLRDYARSIKTLCREA